MATAGGCRSIGGVVMKTHPSRWHQINLDHYELRDDGAVLGQITRTHDLKWTWRAGMTGGYKRGFYAAQRAVRKALKEEPQP